MGRRADETTVGDPALRGPQAPDINRSDPVEATRASGRGWGAAGPGPGSVPVAAGLHGIGDSVGVTNPTLGRGLALTNAADLVHVIEEHAGAGTAQALAMGRACRGPGRAPLPA